MDDERDFLIFGRYPSPERFLSTMQRAGVALAAGAARSLVITLDVDDPVLRRIFINDAALALMAGVHPLVLCAHAVRYAVAPALYERTRP